MRGLPAPEDFVVVADQDGFAALECPVGKCRSRMPKVLDLDLGSLMTEAKGHVARVHDHCDARGSFGQVGNLKEYVCDRRTHEYRVDHHWVEASSVVRPPLGGW